MRRLLLEASDRNHPASLVTFCLEAKLRQHNAHDTGRGLSLNNLAAIYRLLIGLFVAGHLQR
jgi:hypothetical protein